MLKLITFVMMLTFSGNSAANMWVNLGGVSRHFDTGNTQFNEVNNGFGLEVGVKGVTVSAGVYHNSIARESRYAMVEKILASARQFGVGLSIGTLDGYYFRDGGFFPVILPTLRWDGDMIGMRMLFVPPVDDKVTAAIALQFRILVK